MVYWFSTVAVRSYHKLSGLKQHDFLSHSSTGQKSGQLGWFLCFRFHEFKVRLCPLPEAQGLDPLPASSSCSAEFSFR